MSERLRRALRTLVQTLPPAAIAGALVAFGVISPEQGVALMVPLTASMSFAYNLLEERGVPVPIRRG